jgi:hypothetical protein
MDPSFPPTPIDLVAGGLLRPFFHKARLAGAFLHPYLDSSLESKNTTVRQFIQARNNASSLLDKS